MEEKKNHFKVIALVGAELEENLALRYMAAALENKGHIVHIIEFNDKGNMQKAADQAVAINPDILGLSMIFTARAQEFCACARQIRQMGYKGHVIAGGPFAAFNGETLLSRFPEFDSVALGEGEWLICELAENLETLHQVDGLMYRDESGAIKETKKRLNPDNIDELPFPKRIGFHDYFGKKIASILSSRGCWRNCAFCSIHAWYKKSSGKRFRMRSLENIISEMKLLYHEHQIRIFNFQDDNFFHPDKKKAARRFKELVAGLEKEGVHDIAIAVKARPDSITHAAMEQLDKLNIFRVFLGVENASEHGLKNLNRKNTLKEILTALEILNTYDVHLAFNILMFEPYTTMDDILINLDFLERHIENPFNFCRAEAYPGTGLEKILLKEKILDGDWFGYDYRLLNKKPEMFHSIANYAFFDRNFNNNGLHYFNMQVDFYFQLFRRFLPHLLTRRLRAMVKNFIKETNLDTYECLCEIYDFVTEHSFDNKRLAREFGIYMRKKVDSRSDGFYKKGNFLLQQLESLPQKESTKCSSGFTSFSLQQRPLPIPGLSPYGGVGATGFSLVRPGENRSTGLDEILGAMGSFMPYDQLKNQGVI